MSDPRPVYVAEAIIEMSRELVREAWRYQDAWQSLTLAGVPRLDARHVLDRPCRSTPALDAVERWAKAPRGAQGLMGLAGERGVGKTFAAAWWLLHLHRGRRWGKWMACAAWGRLGWPEIRANLTVAARAPALVIDDLTAGQTGKEPGRDPFREAVNGLILERIAEARPTLICSNGSARSLVEWLEPRIFDRLKLSGAIPTLAAVGSMRERDTDDVDPVGRGQEWHRTHDLVESVGCEAALEYTARDKYGDGEYARTLTVGRSLIRAASVSGYEPCRTARRLAGLDQSRVMARARVLEGTDIRTELEAKLELELAALADRFAVPGVVLRDDAGNRLSPASIRAQAENITRSRVCHDAVRSSSRAPGKARVAPGRVKLAPWTEGEDGLRKMRGAGFEVMGQAGVFRVMFGTKIKDMGLPSRAAAWDRAREIASMGW